MSVLQAYWELGCARCWDALTGGPGHGLAGLPECRCATGCGAACCRKTPQAPAITGWWWRGLAELLARRSAPLRAAVLGRVLRQDHPRPAVTPAGGLPASHAAPGAATGTTQQHGGSPLTLR